MDLLVGSINQKDVIDVPSVFRAMELQRLTSAWTEVVTQLEEERTLLMATLPCASQQLELAIEFLEERMVALFSSKIETCSETVQQEIQDRVQDIVHEVTFVVSSLNTRNEQLAWEQALVVVRDEASKSTEQFVQWSVEHMGSEEEMFEEEFERLRQSQKVHIEARLQHLPQLLGTNRLDEMVEQAEKKQTGTLDLKKAQTRSALLGIVASTDYHQRQTSSVIGSPAYASTCFLLLFLQKFGRNKCCKKQREWNGS